MRPTPRNKTNRADNASQPQKKKTRFTYYAWLTDKGDLDYQSASSNGYVYVSAEDKAISVIESADWYTPTTFRKAWKVENREDGGKRKILLRNRENIHSFTASFSDIDGEGELPLTFDVLLQRCHFYNIPLPSYILRTSPNHYQAAWLYLKELLNRNPKMLPYWEAVQTGIYELFKDVGADSQAKEAVGYLRNPRKCCAVNNKYKDKPPVELEYVGEKTTLKALYTALKNAGFIKARERSPKKRRGQIPFSVSMKRLQHFLMHNPCWVGTHQELFGLLGIPERTGYVLIKRLKDRGALHVEKVRVGRTWKSRFTSHFDTASISKTLFFNSNNRNTNNLYTLFYQIFLTFTRDGLPCGVRNDGVFLLALWLKVVGGIEEQDVIELMSRGFVKSKRGSHVFGEGEFKKTVRNAFKERYAFSHSLQSERFWKVDAKAHSG